LHVAKLSYTLTRGEQTGTDFKIEKSETKQIGKTAGALATYDLI
jgi:type III restriction enzyme